MIRSPTATEPPAIPSGPTTSARPTRPTVAASTVGRGTRSRARARQTTICNGTEPAIIAATPESILVSATWTRPTPQARRATPSPAADSTSRLLARSDRRATVRIPASTTAAARNRVPPVRRGGSVRTASLMPRYVEPQTR